MEFEDLIERYPGPLMELLRREGTLCPHPEEWPRYEEWGIGREHIPGLVRMASDVGLVVDPPDDICGWGQIHAARALAQFGAVEGIQPLVDFLCWLEDEDDSGDWQTEEFPQLMGLFGPPAIEPLVRVLHNVDEPSDARWLTASGLAEIAVRHPETRDRAVEALRAALRTCDRDEDHMIATWIVSELCRLKATEAVDEVRGVFERDLIDYFVVDWYDVRKDMGVEELHPEWQRLTDEERELVEKRVMGEAELLPLFPDSGLLPFRSLPPVPGAKKTDKAKKKKAEKKKRKDRKRNRR